VFETVFNEITWDIHGSAHFSPTSAYRDLLGPMFDNAYSSIIEDLQQSGVGLVRCQRSKTKAHPSLHSVENQPTLSF
jgi:hypothetical protein